MPLPPLHDRIEMFLTAVADRCKTCFVHGMCDRCLSLDARRLLADWKVERAMSVAREVRMSGLTEADKFILSQLKGGRVARGDKLQFPYVVTANEKREIMQRLVDRGLVTYELYGQKGHQFRQYKLACKLSTQHS